MQGSRKINLVASAPGTMIELSPTAHVVPTASTNSDRANPVMVGDVLVECTAASTTQADAVSAADSTGTPGRLAYGIVTKLQNSKGVPLNNQYIETTEAGLAYVVPVKNNKFMILEDGVGGNIADADAFGYCALIRGTATDHSRDETDFPNPQPGTMLDSSTVSSGTASNRMIHLLGPVPSTDNLSGRRTFLCEFTSAFTAA